MAKINMKENPFFLDEEAQEWVLDTWKKMSLEQKCGQVFCPMGLGNDPELLKHLTQDIGVGGLMYRADTTKNIQQTHRMLQEFSDIPLLLAEMVLRWKEHHLVSRWRLQRQIIQKMDIVWDLQHAKKELRLD